MKYFRMSFAAVMICTLSVKLSYKRYEVGIGSLRYFLTFVEIMILSNMTEKLHQYL